MAGLVLLTVVALERDRPGWAGLCLAASFYLKIYGAAAGILALMYPCRWRASAWQRRLVCRLGSVAAGGGATRRAFGPIPGWLAILASDHHSDYGLSVMGVADAWLGLRGIEGWLDAAGHRSVCSLLWPGCGNTAISIFAWECWHRCWSGWSIFNHKAESPTYVIAVTGLAIWYVTAPSSRLDTVVLAAAFLLTCWTSGRPGAALVRANRVGPYRIKAIGSICRLAADGESLIVHTARPTKPSRRTHQIEDWREQKIVASRLNRSPGHRGVAVMRSIGSATLPSGRTCGRARCAPCRSPTEQIANRGAAQHVAEKVGIGNQPLRASQHGQSREQSSPARIIPAKAHRQPTAVAEWAEGKLCWPVPWPI